MAGLVQPQVPAVGPQPAPIDSDNAQQVLVYDKNAIEILQAILSETQRTNELLEQLLKKG